MGNWYQVVKTIKGNRYLYEQQTYREGERVRTRNRYLGRVAEADSAASGTGAVFGNASGNQTDASGQGRAAPAPEPVTTTAQADHEDAALPSGKSIRACEKCGADTGAKWKTLCRNCWNRQTPDEIRAHRQAKLDRKISRMRARADRLDTLGDQKKAGLEAFHGDIAFFTQPNINTSGGRSFTKY
jgi:hypothetical protein